MLVLLARGALALPFGVPEVALGVIAYVSYRCTPRAVHEANHFGFGPIASVAVIFAGVFVTMTQPLLLLNARVHQIGPEQPWQYFWASGGLSSVLDNAPTYLAFTSVAAGRLGIGVEHRGVRMPHFFAYALLAMLIMLPVLIAATFLFFDPGEPFP